MTAQPIAVIASAVNYPGAASPAQLWSNVLHRERAFRPFPPERLATSTYRNTGFPADDLIATTAGLMGHWSFDPRPYRLPPSMVHSADTAHWLALDTAAQLVAELEGIWGELPHATTGVVLGNSLTGETIRANSLRHRYPTVAAALTRAASDQGMTLDPGLMAALEEVFRGAFPEPDTDALAGALSNTIAGRITNYFDFRGLAYTVDGACSSSLLSIITACDLLAADRADLVIAGGVDVSLDPFELVGFSRLGALAQSEMRIYDAHPTGFLPGEGCGMVALTRLTDALRRGVDPIAVIRGGGISTDGAGGLTRPSIEGHVLAMERAYQAAGIDPADVGLFEGHGTGTAVGDPTEIAAFSTIRRDAPHPATLGSIKANIGHTKAAAGVAGFIKATMAVHHGVLPPTTGVRDPHPLLNENTAVQVADEPEAWDGPRIAGVSAMGFGGINTHVVISASPHAHPPRPIPHTARIAPREVMALTGDSWAQILGQAEHLLEQLAFTSDAEAMDMIRSHPADLAAPVRVAATVNCRASIVQILDGLPEERPSQRLTRLSTGAWVGTERGSVGLLFPGQAAPLPKRRHPLLEADIDNEWATAARHAFTTLPDPVGHDTAITQPWTVAASFLGLAWLQQLGVTADVSVGHSLGELTALAWAGATPPTTMLKLVGERGQLMSQLGRPATGMVSFAAPRDRVDALIHAQRTRHVEIATINGPEQIVVAGPVAELNQLTRDCPLEFRRLRVSHGFHSAAMTPVLNAWATQLAGTPLAPLNRPILSTISGKRLTAGTAVTAQSLVDQLTSPVLFADAVAAMHETVDLAVEVGTGSMLTTLATMQTTMPVVSLELEAGTTGTAAATAALVAAGSANSLSAWHAMRPLPRPATVHTFITNPAAMLENTTTTAPRAARVIATSTMTPPPSDGTVTAQQAIINGTATFCGLHPSELTNDLNLATDLHLNSLQVGQLANQAIAATGKTAPQHPLAASTATIGELIDLVDALPAADMAADGGLTSVAAARFPWVRAFCDQWIPCDTSQMIDPGVIVDSRGDRVHAAALEILHLTETELDTLTILHDGPGAGLARSLDAEQRTPHRLVSIDLPADQPIPDSVPAPPGGYLDARLTDEGWQRRVSTPVTPTQGPTIVPPGDCLVTGGVDGITAECGFELAHRFGCSLYFTGRRSAEAVKEPLQRLIDAGIDAHYIPCDITCADDVQRLFSHLTPTIILHGAGLNTPSAITQTSLETLARTAAPKVDGLATLLAQHPQPDRLTHLITFGSIIGRSGLTGELEYCLANTALRQATEAIAEARPDMVVRHLEWSVWTGVGMGVTLGVVDQLRRSGVQPLSPADGVSLFMATLDPSWPVTSILTGPLPQRRSIEWLSHPVPLRRYTERVAAGAGGVDAVVECEISTHTDRALRDHVIDQVPVLPAVCGMEAMAQTLERIDGQPPTSLAELRFVAPVTVSPDKPSKVLIAAARDGHQAKARVLAESDGFAHPLLHACTTNTPPPALPHVAHTSITTQPIHHLYGDLFFHRGAFSVVQAAQASASTLVATLHAEPNDWYPAYMPADAILGDPGILDGTIHALQLCYPTRQLLPTSATAFHLHQPPQSGITYTLVAHETGAFDPDTPIFDVWLVDENKGQIVTWQGLTLQRSGELRRPTSEGFLLGPWVARTLRELTRLPIDVVSTAAATTSAAAIGLISDQPATHTPCGRLRTADAYASSSTWDNERISTTSPIPIGIDLIGNSPAIGQLSTADEATATSLTSHWANPAIWAAREAATKAGDSREFRVHLEDPSRIVLTTDGGAVVILKPDHRIVATFLGGWQP